MKRTRVIDPEQERVTRRPPPPLEQQIAGLGLFTGQAEIVPSQHTVRVKAHTRTVKGSAPARGVEGRDAALAMLKAQRADLFAKLCAEAIRIWREQRSPISVNDIRHVLTKEGYDGDARLLGTVFANKKEWQKVGQIRTDSKLANARDISTFVFRHPLDAIVRS